VRLLWVDDHHAGGLIILYQNIKIKIHMSASNDENIWYRHLYDGLQQSGRPSRAQLIAHEMCVRTS
jgi:hypothetical protein